LAIVKYRNISRSTLTCFLPPAYSAVALTAALPVRKSQPTPEATTMKKEILVSFHYSISLYRQDFRGKITIIFQNQQIFCDFF